MGAVLLAVLVAAALAPREPATASEQVAEISQTIRCPTCSGESVAQSDADISKQIRLDVAQRLQRGQTPDQIRAYYAERYGEGILLTPQSGGLVGLVWILPVAALVLAVGGLVIVFRRWSETPPVHASDADRELVERALEETPGDG
jgi:cytochrome c-type biogenesis protein CcmH